MRKINFTKMQGSGNDFIVVDAIQSQVTSNQSLIKKICDRKYGIGADGVLLIEKSKIADIRMRIFNADGSEASMCGNGARCASFYIALKKKKKSVSLETRAGILSAEVEKNSVKIKLTDPVDLKVGICIKVNGKDYEASYINTGVPHVVIQTGELDKIPVKELGRAIRYHEIFKPAGANVDFIKVLDKSHILVRTYERGVEDETLACGTGSVASAIIALLNSCGESLDNPGKIHKVYVKTKGGETLVVYFKVTKKKIVDVWLQGRASIVFKGDWLLA